MGASGINLVRKRSKRQEPVEKERIEPEGTGSSNQLKIRLPEQEKELVLVRSQRQEIPRASWMVAEVVAMGVSGYGKMEGVSWS